MMKHLNVDLIDPSIGLLLTPSYHGADCAGNGENGEACCCDECNYFQICFPELKSRYWPDLEGMDTAELLALYDRYIDDDSVPMERLAAIAQELRWRDPLPDPKVEQIVRNCVADLAFEGMECTEEDVARMRRVASGETTADEEIAQIKARFRKEEE